MGLNCSCPASAALTAITIEDCVEDIGQVQKLVFQRLKQADGTVNKFVIATANPNVLASWTPLIAAADGTKVVASPFVQNPEVEAGAPRTYGGGNQTVGGIEIIVGREPTSFTSMVLRTKQRSTIKELKKLSCEAAANNLGVFLVDEHGRITGKTNSGETEVYPIPVRSLFVGDKKIGGLEEPDSNVLSFQLLPNWSDDLFLVTPSDFNALEDLHP